MPRHTVNWIDGGREARHPSNPAYPTGIDLDLSDGALASCMVRLPWPARRCGYYVITCPTCHLRVAITTAGRPDDPRSAMLPCKMEGNT